MPSQHAPGPSDPSDDSPESSKDVSPEAGGHLPRSAVVAILLQAVFYPALVFLSGWTSFMVIVFFVMAYSTHYVWFPLVFGTPLLIVLLLATLLLHHHLRSTGFPRPGTTTVLMVCALLSGLVHVRATGALGWSSDPVGTIGIVATVTVYTLVTAFALILYWSGEPRFRPRWKILVMAGAVLLACAVAWAGAQITHERELDRRVRQHVGYDQMSPVDQEILKDQYERGEEPRLGPAPGHG